MTLVPGYLTSGVMTFGQLDRLPPLPPQRRESLSEEMEIVFTELLLFKGMK